MPVAFWARPGESTMQQTPGILTVAGPGYFEAAGTRLLRGRTFEATDRRGGEPVAVVNDAMARLIAPDGNAARTLCAVRQAGQRVAAAPTSSASSRSQRRFYLDDEPQPRVFLAWAQSPNAVPFGIPSLIVRTHNPARDAAAVRAALQSLRERLAVRVRGAAGREYPRRHAAVPSRRDAVQPVRRAGARAGGGRACTACSATS